VRVSVVASFVVCARAAGLPPRRALWPHLALTARGGGSCKYLGGALWSRRRRDGGASGLGLRSGTVRVGGSCLARQPPSRSTVPLVGFRHSRPRHARCHRSRDHGDTFSAEPAWRWSTSKMQHTASDKERSCRVAPPTLVTGWRGQPARCRDERGAPCHWWCGYRGCQRRFKHHCCTPDEIPCPSLSPSPPAHHLAMQRHAVSISGSTVAAPRWSWRAG